MTDDDLAAIDARVQAATAGPWTLHDKFGYAVVHGLDGVGPVDPADGAFIAHARTDVPALLAEVRSLRGAVPQRERA